MILIITIVSKMLRDNLIQWSTVETNKVVRATAT